MFDALETGFGLDVILWLQSMRHPFLAWLAEFLDFAGDELIFIALLSMIYWAFNKALGLRLVFLLILIILLTAFTKDILATDRPYQISDAVEELFTESSYGVPSGHVSISLAIWGYFAWYLKKRWLWALVIIYVTLQFFARMIAGVHYPQDVVAGLILAGLTIVLYIPLSERFASFWQASASPVQLGVILGTSLLLLLLVLLAPLSEVQAEYYLTPIGLLLGASLGVWLEGLRVNFQAHAQKWRRAIQFILGLALAIGLLLGLSLAFDAISETGLIAEILRVLRYGFVALTALALWPWASIKLGLMETTKSKSPNPSA